MSFFFATLFKRMVPPSKKRKIEKKEESYEEFVPTMLIIEYSTLLYHNQLLDV